jgi:hypothetical protein
MVIPRTESESMNKKTGMIQSFAGDADERNRLILVIISILFPTEYFGSRVNPS